MLHPELRAFLDRFGFASLPCQPRVTLALRFDEGLRVRFHPHSNGEVSLEARLRSLPQSAAACEGLLDAALELQRLLAPGHESWLAVNRQGNLVLQQTIPSGLGMAGFESSLEDFLNVLECCKLALSKEY